MTLRGSEEALPKMVIHLPPTPVTEYPPISPIVINKPKVQPKLSIQLGAPKSETVSTPTLGKIRLPGIVPRPTITTSDSATHQKKIATVKPLVSLSSKKKKPKEQAKGQSGGMSNNDLRACRNALKRLTAHKSSPLFLQPVDPIRDRAPK